MAKVIRVKNNNIGDAYKKLSKVLKKGLQKPHKQAKALFTNIAVMLDRDTVRTFKNEGAWNGNKKWPALGNGRGVGVYQDPNTGKWAHRYGTDNAKTRRYGQNSKPLLASGLFQKSFEILNIQADRMTFGTRHKLAESIMSNPTRQVLHYTRLDQNRYARIVGEWMKKGIKF